MYYAHLPAGYVSSKILFKKFEKSRVACNAFISWGMIGAIAPDFDLIYCFFIDQAHRHHHQYFTHFPLFWLTLVLISFLWLRFDHKHGRSSALAFIFTLNGFIHTILDTAVGYMYVLKPFVDMDKPFTLANHIPMDSHYLELFIFLWALYLLKKNQIIGLFARLGSSLDLID
jgi:hypothetical protein